MLPGARVLALALACAPLTACVLAAEAELPDVEVASHGIAVPAAPPEADSNDVMVGVSFRQKPNRAGLAKDAFSNVRVLSVSLNAIGLANLGFLRSLRITATSDEADMAGRAPIEITRYARPAVPITSPTLQMKSEPPADITELWRSKEVIFTLEVAGQLPTVAWSADVGMRVSATLKY